MKSDIALIDDKQISRENHCSIVFDPKKIKFSIVKGDGEVIVSGNSLDNTQTLEGDEIIEMGASSFVFIPYCKEGRMW